MESDNFARTEGPESFRSRKGCLVESVVVFGIVGIGTMLVIPAVNSARNAARQSQFT